VDDSGRVTCQACGGTTAAIAKKCVHCGAEVARSRAAVPRPAKIVCPECGVATIAVTLGNISIDRCAHCGGAWFDRAEIDQFATGISEDGLAQDAREILELSTKRPPHRLEAVRYKTCPVCYATMHRRNFKSSSGVIVDVCANDGSWLDLDDLQLFLSILANGGLAELERRAQEIAIANQRDTIRSLESRAADLAWQLHRTSARVNTLYFLGI
jgi:Zn-finger nucleic acid-binding protein